MNKNIFSNDPASTSAARVKAQVSGIERFLRLKSRARVLDLGCGAGSQTLELARRKYRVVGMDEFSASFPEARSLARNEKLTVHFSTNDMRRIPYEGEFDAILNLRNPIGWYGAESSDLKCLKGIHKALKRGGKVLLDLLNREWMIRRLGVREQRFDFQLGRLHCKNFSGRGGRVSVKNSMRIYSLTEIIRLLEEAYLSFSAVWGDYSGKGYSIETQRMLVLAEKKSAAPKSRGRVQDSLPRAMRIKGRSR